MHGTCRFVFTPQCVYLAVVKCTNSFNHSYYNSCVSTQQMFGVKNSSTFACTLTTRFDRDCIVRDDSRTRTPAQCRWNSSRTCSSEIAILIRALCRMPVSIGTPTGTDCQFISGSTVSQNNNICRHCIL